ncbi:MAG: peptidoglycan DD-metalloendopeptidase family protein [Burkholderiaceae bacterium]|nr:peptidoglycan DD-metalloendopeptidase family protein [Burkholderiaceae bacterium]
MVRRAHDLTARPCQRGVRASDRGRKPARARRALRVGAALAVACAVAACSTARTPAPVEQRNPVAQPPAPVVLNGSPAAAPAVTPPAQPAAQPAVPAPPAADAAAAKPGAENAGKPGYYTIKPGDTLIRVGLETGQNARDIARWNNIENPSALEVGRVIRVVPPGVDPAATAARGVSNARVEARPLDARPPASAGSGVAPPPLTSPAVVAALPAPAATATPPVTTASAASAARDADDDVTWAWPSADPVIGTFDDAKNKGLTFGGKAGDPVYAAADGRVVYAGSGLRGYGNLVIVKHNNTYLTAYAHNRALLVKEDQVVRRGQKIAEMGSSDADRVQLHFEIRRMGRPIDPARLLPPR